MDDKKLYIIIKSSFSVIIRVFCSGILGLFALLPSYFLILALIRIFSGEMERGSFYSNVSLSIFLLLMLGLACFLWLLSWRALTGKSTRIDGSLMPPFVMSILSNILGIIGGGVILHALYSGEYIRIIGGLNCMLFATVLYQKKQNS